MYKDSRQIKGRIIRKTDLIKTVIECRQSDVQTKLAELLAANYTPYDMAAAGASFSAFGALTPGNYVIYWRAPAESAYTINVTNIQNHTNVVILLAEVNSANQVVSQVSTGLEFITGDYASKLTVYGGVAKTPSMATPKNLIFENLRWEVNGATTVENLTKTSVRIILNANLTEVFSAYKAAKNIHISGNYEYKTQISVSSISDNWLTNVVFESLSKLNLEGVTSFRTFNFINVLIKDMSKISVIRLSTTAKSCFYYDSAYYDITLSESIWNLRGTAGQSTGSAEYNKLEYDNNGVLHLAFKDVGNSSKLTVKRFVSGAWSLVGSAGISAGSVSFIGMCFDTATNAYLAYADGNNSNGITIQKWNGTAWSTIYSGSYTVTSYVSMKWESNKLAIVFQTATGQARFISFDTQSNTVDYTVLFDGSYPVYNPVIKSMNSFLGHNAVGITAFVYEYTADSLGNRTMTKITGITGVNNILYDAGYIAVYVSPYGSHNFALYSLSGTTATMIGSIVSGIAISQQTASMRVMNGTAYIGYKDSNSKITVKNNSAGALETVGAASFSAGTADHIGIAVRSSVPDVCYMDGSQSSKVTVMKYDDSTSVSTVNYICYPYSGNVLSGKLQLNTDLLLDDSEFFTQECILKGQNTIVSNMLGKTMRNGYQISFEKKTTVDDRLKQMGADDYFARYYPDELMIDCLLKNYRLFDSNQNAFDYNNNDNFLVITQNSSGEIRIFIYYNKKWRKTCFSDAYPNEGCTIIRCIQILEMTELSEMLNVFANYQDSPLETGSITFNNYDNEVVA